MQLWRSRNTKKSFSSVWMSQSSFKLLINWAIIMMYLWEWRGRNNLQVGEMRHERLLSLTCAMLLVCVRSRQIPSAMSPSASVMGGWEHQLPPPFIFCQGTICLSPGCCFCGSTSSPCGPSLRGRMLGSWNICFSSQVPPSEQDTATEPSPLQGRKGVKKWNFWVPLGQLHILLCLPPPDLMHSWIMVCHPLHTSYSNSGYIFAALSTVAQEYLTCLWNTSPPLRSNIAPLCHPHFPAWTPVSGVSRLLYRKHCESSGMCRINKHKVNSKCLKSVGWAGSKYCLGKGPMHNCIYSLAGNPV